MSQIWVQLGMRSVTRLRKFLHEPSVHCTPKNVAFVRKLAHLYRSGYRLCYQNNAKGRRLCTIQQKLTLQDIFKLSITS